MKRTSLPLASAALAALLLCLPAAASAAPAPRPAATKPAPAEPTDTSGAVINLNEATADQLTFLPGIGESKAERIIAFRAKQPFKTPNDLTRVRGIGPKTVRKLKPWIRVSGPTTLSGPVRAPKSASDGEPAAAP